MKEKTDVNPIKAAFDDALKEAGFHKKSATWYLEKEEVVLVANLQKSQWGQQYYLRCGSLSGIKEALQEEQLSNAMVRKEVKDLLSES